MPHGLEIANAISFKKIKLKGKPLGFPNPCGNNKTNQFQAA